MLITQKIDFNKILPIVVVNVIIGPRLKRQSLKIVVNKTTRPILTNYEL